MDRAVYSSLAHPSGLFEGVFNSLPLALGGPLIRCALGLCEWALFGAPRAYARAATAPFQTDEARAVVRACLHDGGANFGRGFALDSQQALSPLYARPRADAPAGGGGELSAEAAYGRIDAPVALWYGAVDTTVPVRTARWLAAHIPRASLHVVPAAGHGLYIDHAPAVLDELVDKLKLAGAAGGDGLAARAEEAAAQRRCGP